MSKVIDLQSYREKHGQSATDNEILLDVVHDASREMLVNAIWIAKDLDIDIEDMHFIEQMSSSFHHYSEALKQGFLSPVSKAVTVPDDLKRAGFISVDDAISKLIRPDFKDVGEQMPKKGTFYVAFKGHFGGVGR